MAIKYSSFFQFALSFVLFIYLFFHCQVHKGQWGRGRWRQTRTKLHSAVPACHGQSTDSFRSWDSWSPRPDQLHAGLWLAGGHYRAGVGLPEGRGPPDCTATGQEDTGGKRHGDDHYPGKPCLALTGHCRISCVAFPNVFALLKTNSSLLQLGFLFFCCFN